MKGFKTLSFNALTAVVVLLEMQDVINAIPPDWHPYAMLALALANIGLRFVTTTPVGRG